MFICLPESHSHTSRCFLTLLRNQCGGHLESSQGQPTTRVHGKNPKVTHLSRLRGRSCARKREEGYSAQEVKLCLVSSVCVFSHFLFLDLATLASIRWHIARITAAVPRSRAQQEDQNHPTKKDDERGPTNVIMRLSPLFYWGGSENTPLKIYRNQDPRSTPAADEHPHNLVKTLQGRQGYRSKPWSTRTQRETLAGWRMGSFPSVHTLCLGGHGHVTRESHLSTLFGQYSFAGRSL